MRKNCAEFVGVEMERFVFVKVTGDHEIGGFRLVADAPPPGSTGNLRW